MWVTNMKMCLWSREPFILGHQCPAGTVTYLFFSIQWPLISVTTEAANLPMGSSMPVFICFVCWAVWNWTLPVCEEVGRGGSKPSGDSALSVCACMFCVCLSGWHWFWGPWHQLMHTKVCVPLFKGSAVSFSHTIWGVVSAWLLDLKSSLQLGYTIPSILVSTLDGKQSFCILVIIFSAMLIKNTAVTCPKPECSLGFYFTLGSASFWGVCTVQLLYYSSIFFS